MTQTEQQVIEQFDKKFPHALWSEKDVTEVTLKGELKFVTKEIRQEVLSIYRQGVEAGKREMISIVSEYEFDCEHAPEYAHMMNKLKQSTKPEQKG